MDTAGRRIFKFIIVLTRPAIFPWHYATSLSFLPSRVSWSRKDEHVAVTVCPKEECNVTWTVALSTDPVLICTGVGWELGGGGVYVVVSVLPSGRGKNFNAAIFC